MSAISVAVYNRLQASAALLALTTDLHPLKTVESTTQKERWVRWEIQDTSRPTRSMDGDEGVLESFIGFRIYARDTATRSGFTDAGSMEDAIVAAIQDQSGIFAGVNVRTVRIESQRDVDDPEETVFQKNVESSWIWYP